MPISGNHPSQLWSAAACALTLLLTGCNIVGPAFFFIAGPPKSQPKYVLDKDRTAVVFVDDRNSVLPSRASRSRIAKEAERVLLDAKALKADLISSDAVMTLTSADRFGKPLGIAQVGERAGAEQVIYAAAAGFTLSPDGSVFAPNAVLRVKVIDAKTRQRLWPIPADALSDKNPADPDGPALSAEEQAEWYTLTVNAPAGNRVIPTSSVERGKAEQALAELAGRELGRLFVEASRELDDRRVGNTGAER